MATLQKEFKDFPYPKIRKQQIQIMDFVSSCLEEKPPSTSQELMRCLEVNIEAIFNNLNLLGLDSSVLSLVGGILGALSGFGPVSQSLSLNSFNFNNPAAIAVAVAAIILSVLYLVFDHSGDALKAIGIFIFSIIAAVVSLLLSTSDIQYLNWMGRAI